MSSEDENTALKRVRSFIRGFFVTLEEVLGWRSWRRNKIAYTLDYDDYELVTALRAAMPEEFVFPPETEGRHKVIIGFSELAEAVQAFKDVEYYFRRYPFRGLRTS